MLELFPILVAKSTVFICFFSSILLSFGHAPINTLSASAKAFTYSSVKIFLLEVAFLGSNATSNRLFGWVFLNPSITKFTAVGWWAKSSYISVSKTCPEVYPFSSNTCKTTYWLKNIFCCVLLSNDLIFFQF